MILCAHKLSSVRAVAEPLFRPAGIARSVGLRTRARIRAFARRQPTAVSKEGATDRRD